MDTVLELCAVCAAGDGPAGTLIESVLSFIVQKTAHVALPHMSAMERGALTLQLISAGGLQHDVCRQFLFKELSPPYSTTAIVRQSHELYIRPAERMARIDVNENTTMLSRRKKCSLPFLSLLRKSGDVERNQPPVDFHGEDAEQLLAALLQSWNFSNAASLPHSWSLRELPPGLATYLTLHYPARTLQLLRTTIVGPSVPQTWRDLWRQIFFFAADADATADTMHKLLSQGACANFWPAALRALVHPLTGTVGDTEPETNLLANFEGPSTFLTHALLCLWLSESKHDYDMGRMEALSGNAELRKETSSFLVAPLVPSKSSSFLSMTTDEVHPLWRRTLIHGLRLVEKDEAYGSHEEPQRGRAAVVQAAYALLLSLYHGHSMASQYVRSALDHPDVTLFVPSFEDLNGELSEGAQWGGDEGICSISAFLAALALRIPAAQLYIAERVWRHLETMLAPGEVDARERQTAELDARLRILLNSFAFSDVPLAVAPGGRGTSVPPVHTTVATLGEGSQKREDGPRLTLRLKRPRAEGQIPQTADAGRKDTVKSKSQTRMAPTSSDISLAASLLRNALIDFATEEIVQPSNLVYSSAPGSTSAATSDGQLSRNKTRLMLLIPPHMKSFLGFFSAFSSSSPCSLMVCNVCCVIMSVFLYRQCYALQRWLLHEAKSGLKAAVVGRFVWRVRRWLRFLAPLGVFCYAPVSDVLLPECLREMEKQKEKTVDDGSGATATAILKELCGVLMSAI
ncbi:hypothetical protein TcG_01841 [Trypanosoma cruzi]|uniref:Uncharacterized protein n=2 Tax=Trypanosoma cruzi TaxID=5693 RepID=A0A2V2VTJ3_TRYCR|nr:hypothetical protein BCY84_02126 [Trypanosoma cruzi cruzi]PWU98528.1 hypothetical protein C4B63_12g154 [Trypanosoma cruzi]RNF22917.1 hypothetical protein TcG_01841 [Trypanosoma cruzi]